MNEKKIPFNEEHFDAWQNDIDKEREEAIEKFSEEEKRKFLEISDFTKKLIEYKIPFHLSLLAPDPNNSISTISYCNFSKLQFLDKKIGTWASQRIILDFFLNVGYYSRQGDEEFSESAINYLNKASDELSEDLDNRESYAKEEIRKFWNN